MADLTTEDKLRYLLQSLMPPKQLAVEGITPSYTYQALQEPDLAGTSPSFAQDANKYFQQIMAQKPSWMSSDEFISKLYDQSTRIPQSSSDYSVQGVPIRFGNLGSAAGAYDPKTKEIIAPVSEPINVRTLTHELQHALGQQQFSSVDTAVPYVTPQQDYDRYRSQGVESIAFSTGRHFIGPADQQTAEMAMDEAEASALAKNARAAADELMRLLQQSGNMEGLPGATQAAFEADRLQNEAIEKRQLLEAFGKQMFQPPAKYEQVFEDFYQMALQGLNLEEPKYEPSYSEVGGEPR